VLSGVLLTTTTGINIGPWVEGSQTQIENILSQGGPFLFLIFGTVCGVGLIMALVRKVIG
jgi:hypothetical protein